MYDTTIDPTGKQKTPFRKMKTVAKIKDQL